MTYPVSSIDQAVEAIKRGEFVVVLDNEDRENEGDLIMAAEYATETSLAFMIRYSSGVICVPALEKRLKKLELPLMVPNNSESRQCKFTISVDLRTGNTTGISAADRARTIKALADDRMSAEDFRRPGHIFPLLALDGGVIARAGHTEAAIDLTRLAGCKPIGYICEINDDTGKMMRRPELESFAKQNNLHLITISDLIRYRFSSEVLIAIDGPMFILPTPNASFECHKFVSLVDSRRFEVLVHGKVRSEVLVLVHIAKDDIKGIINAQWAQQEIQLAAAGVIIYSSQRNILEEISGKLMAEQINFGMCMQILKKFGVKTVRLLTETSIGFDVSGFGVEVDGAIMLTI